MAELGTIKAQLTGISRYMQHNQRLANPLDPYAKLVREIAKKRNKTDEEYAELAQREFFGGIYSDPTVGPYVPSAQIMACLLAAAKTLKLGQKFKAGVYCLEEMIPLQYDGPRITEKLFADKQFVDTRSVVVNRSRTQRTRPVFDKWSITVELLVDTEIINLADVKRLFAIAGSLIGIGELRPMLGRFTSEVL